jgi:hypothetical protein
MHQHFFLHHLVSAKFKNAKIFRIPFWLKIAKFYTRENNPRYGIYIFVSHTLNLVLATKFMMNLKFLPQIQIFIKKYLLLKCWRNLYTGWHFSVLPAYIIWGGRKSPGKKIGSKYLFAKITTKFIDKLLD